MLQLEKAMSSLWQPFVTKKLGVSMNDKYEVSETIDVRVSVPIILVYNVPH